ncbi:MAG: hypothetical protein JRJ56_01065 [Deltaproteobacteria bacterium]|nr:hypothetical protein [Deltaproteobacteria bacterium]
MFYFAVVQNKPLLQVPQNRPAGKGKKRKMLFLSAAARLTGRGRQPGRFSALSGARLPVFPTAHAAKVAKLALPGSDKATLTLYSPGKTTAARDVAPENHPGCRR